MAAMSSTRSLNFRHLQATPKSDLIHFDQPDSVDFDPCKSKQSAYVQKRAFSSQNFRLSCGVTLEWVQFGYECMGQLNESRDNAILIPHYFTGSSHFAGKYREADIEKGYWDSLVGPGLAIDTNRYFVIGVDSICNVNPLHPFVITTGPASIDPVNGDPYGARFPWITITDSVRAHRKLVDALGISRLRAVIGPSMGSMSALEWAAEFPDSVGSVIGIIGGGLQTPAYLVQELRLWCHTILLDPDFNEGHYPLEHQPRRGLAATLEQVTHSARTPQWASHPPLLDGGSFEQKAFPASSEIERLFSRIGYERSAFADANSFLRTARAVQNYSVRDRAQNIQSQILWIHATSDLLLMPDYALDGVREMRDLGLNVQSFPLVGSGGHLDGLFEIHKAGEVIAAFLEET